MITMCPNCGLPSQDGTEILRCTKCGYTKEFMEVWEFAKLVGVSTKTINRLEKAGRIKLNRINRLNIRVHRSEYDRLMGLLVEEKQE